MTIEFTPAPEGSHEIPAELHTTSTSSEIATAFETGPEETTLTPTDRRATDMQPEVIDRTPQCQEHQPVATIRERPGPYEQPIRVYTDENDRLVLLDIQQTNLQTHVGWNIEDWQQKLLENFEPQREGLNIEQGDAFLKSLGLPVTTTTLELPAEMRDNVNEVYNLGLNAKIIHGKYLDVADTALTFRDSRLEELNGPEFTEAIRIHELVHSSDDREWCFKIEDEVGNLQPIYLHGYNNLLQDPDAGSFFSEGVSELIAGQYITEVLGKPHGLLDLPEEMSVSAWNSLSLPSRYIILGAQGKQQATSVPAYAAAGLEELIARDPALRPALIGGLYDSEARAEVAGRIRAISPILFEILNHSPEINKLKHFDTGLELIRNLLHR